jgi:3-hydroxyisobutyrate dehydrogenase
VSPDRTKRYSWTGFEFGKKSADTSKGIESLSGPIKGGVMANVTFLGMGAMGSRMARNLVKAGHHVTVWNRTPNRCVPLLDAGALAADTPRDAAGGAEFVFSMVRDVEASRHVWLDPRFGAMQAVSDSAIAVECSTLTIGWIKELAMRFGEREVAFLDAPVAGSRPQADAAKLIFLVGGERFVVEKTRELFETMGSVVNHVGPTGSGATLKLMVNALYGIQVASVAELIAFARGTGFELDALISALSSTPVMSPAAKATVDAILGGKFSPLFPIELVKKDLEYASRSAEGVGKLAPMVRAARDVFEAAESKGFGRDNITGVAKLYS